ncbi:MAG TPA: hypothetical protein VF816_06015 [Rhodocyclaceae bacterium]
MSAGRRRVVLVTRRTRLEELVARYGTLEQARFYLEHLGADFADYQAESDAYGRSLRTAGAILETWGRYQIVDRALLSNFVFAEDDIVVALGQDGLVANTMKYLNGQPLVGVNPEPSRWDGVLARFDARRLAEVLPEITAGGGSFRGVTMAEAVLSDGQRLRAVNDLFVGPRSHTSALYELQHGGRTEFQSSSGVIVSTGLGSTAWLRSIVTGSLAVAASFGAGVRQSSYAPMPWDGRELVFAVREPFPSRASGTSLVFGRVGPDAPLRIRSRMPDSGVIFSDGIESDFLRFTAGVEATITLAPAQGRLAI